MSLARRRLRSAVIEFLERRQLLSTNVVMWHNDPAQTGLNSNEQSLTPTNVNSSSFGKLFSYPVTGQVYAQPLYVSNLSMPGLGTHNVVFVETMNNDVYAFDADSNSGPSAGLLWHVNLGPAATVPSPYVGFRYGPDHDTTPLVGITSTPIIDLSTDTMYIDAFTNDVAGQDVYSHHIHALDITTGQDKVTPMLVSASVKGNGVGGDGTTVTFAADRQLQRAALRLLDGVLYVAYAAYADTDPYHGWLLGFDANTLQLVRVLNTTPNLDTDAERRRRRSLAIGRRDRNGWHAPVSRNRQRRFQCQRRRLRRQRPGDLARHLNASVAKHHRIWPGCDGLFHALQRAGVG